MTGNESMALRLIADQLNRIESRMDDDRAASYESRRKTYERLEAIESRVTKVETVVEASAPGLKEFAETKMQIGVAGRLGIIAWRAGKWVLAACGAIYLARADISAWIKWWLAGK